MCSRVIPGAGGRDPAFDFRTTVTLIGATPPPSTPARATVCAWSGTPPTVSRSRRRSRAAVWSSAGTTVARRSMARPPTIHQAFSVISRRGRRYRSPRNRHALAANIVHRWRRPHAGRIGRRFGSTAEHEPNTVALVENPKSLG
jgi:hypothetical protein